MKISLDAAMRARDVSAPSAADDLAADVGVAEPVPAASPDNASPDRATPDNGTSDEDGWDNGGSTIESAGDDDRPVGDRIPGRPHPRRRWRLRHGHGPNRSAS